MTYAKTERHSLVATMKEAGPDAPTLCGEWTARDLAAHLVIRERRVDALPGIAIKQFAGHTESVQRKVTESTTFDGLLAQIDSGPPLWSPFFLLDSMVNLVELFVHHEDLRRGQPGWEPRLVDPKVAETLYSRAVMIAKMAYRKGTVGVTYQVPGGASTVIAKGAETSTAEMVTVRGAETELLLFSFGRDEVRLEFDGSPAAIAQVKAAKRGM